VVKNHKNSLSINTEFSFAVLPLRQRHPHPKHFGKVVDLFDSCRPNSLIASRFTLLDGFAIVFGANGKVVGSVKRARALKELLCNVHGGFEGGDCLDAKQTDGFCLATTYR
jgi:hypothetical protein